MDVFDNPEKYIQAKKTGGGPPDLKIRKTPAQKKRQAAKEVQREQEQDREQEEFGPPSIDDGEEDTDLYEQPAQPPQQAYPYQQPISPYQYQQPVVQQPPMQQQPPYTPPQQELPPCYNEIVALNKTVEYYKKYLEYHRKLLRYEEALLQRAADFEEERESQPQKPQRVVNATTMADDPLVKRAELTTKEKRTKFVFMGVGALLLFVPIYIVSDMMKMSPMLGIAMAIAGIGGGMLISGIK